MNAAPAALACSRLMPAPMEVTASSGVLQLAGRELALQFEGAWTAGSQQLVSQLLERLSNTGGTALPVRLVCRALAARRLATDADESYSLQVLPDQIYLEAATAVGAQRGVHTLAQLLAQFETRFAAPGTSERPDDRFTGVECLRIDDAPALAWRGLLLDVARHFIEPDALFRTVEGMAHCKLNVLHLHLTDDQAFRFESSAYPRLNEGGQFYRRDELKALVAFAAERGIRVVPELDMPGHTTHWLAAYPEWSLFPVQFTKRFGVHPGCLNPCTDTTYEVIGTLLDEFAEVFNDPCVHVGGDEVHPGWWSEHADTQAFMREHELAEPRDLQAHFNKRVAQLLAERGKRMAVWDEAIHPDLPANVLVQAWRGISARDAAIESGYECIVSAPYYLDLFFPADLHTAIAPQQATDAALACEDQMLDDVRLAHIAEGLKWTLQWRNREPQPRAAEPGQTTGAEACLWSELVTTDMLDVRLWSRLPLLAEMYWRGAAPDITAGDENYTRIAHMLWSFRCSGGPDLLPSLCGTVSAEQLDLLAPLGVSREISELLAVIEPVKWYGRLLGAKALAARLQGSEMPQARPYGTGTPLCGVADVISPQSFRTAEFDELLSRWQCGPLAAQDQESLRCWLRDWQAQSAAVAALALRAPAADDLAVLAGHLLEFSELVLRLVEQHGSTKLDNQALQNINSVVVAQWFEPQEELMLAIVAPLLVRLLVQSPLADA